MTTHLRTFRDSAPTARIFILTVQFVANLSLPSAQSKRFVSGQLRCRCGLALRQLTSQNPQISAHVSDLGSDYCNGLYNSICAIHTVQFRPVLQSTSSTLCLATLVAVVGSVNLNLDHRPCCHGNFTCHHLRTFARDQRSPLRRTLLRSTFPSILPATLLSILPITLSSIYCSTFPSTLPCKI